MVGLLLSSGKAVECNLRPLAPDTDQCCEWASSFWRGKRLFFRGREGEREGGRLDLVEVKWSFCSHSGGRSGCPREGGFCSVCQRLFVGVRSSESRKLENKDTVFIVGEAPRTLDDALWMLLWTGMGARADKNTHKAFSYSCYILCFVLFAKVTNN